MKPFIRAQSTLYFRVKYAIKPNKLIRFASKYGLALTSNSLLIRWKETEQ